MQVWTSTFPNHGLVSKRVGALPLCPGRLRFLSLGPVPIRSVWLVPVQTGLVRLRSDFSGSVTPVTGHIGVARLCTFQRFSMRLDSVRSGSLPLGPFRLGIESLGPSPLSKGWLSSLRLVVVRLGPASLGAASLGSVRLCAVWPDPVSIGSDFLFQRPLLRGLFCSWPNKASLIGLR